MARWKRNRRIEVALCGHCLEPFTGPPQYTLSEEYLEEVFCSAACFNAYEGQADAAAFFAMSAQRDETCT